MLEREEEGHRRDGAREGKPEEEEGRTVSLRLSRSGSTMKSEYVASLSCVSSPVSSSRERGRKRGTTHRLLELDLGLRERRRARDRLALAHGVLWVVHDERALERRRQVGGDDVLEDRGGAERGGELEGGRGRHGERRVRRWGWCGSWVELSV